MLDPPHRPKLAVLDLPLMRDLAAALEEVASDSKLRGLVVTGRDPLSFAGGADVDSIGELTDVAVARRVAELGQSVFEALARLGTERGGRLMTVAAVGGPVPGGAYELSLACDRIVLANDPRSRIGLPEVRLGILPGWGGCQRLPRRVGLVRALEAILQGTLFDARRAKSRGLVDRLAWPVDLVRIADDVAMGRAKCERRGRGLAGWFVDRNPLAAAIIERQSRKAVLAQTRGHYPAPLRALSLVVRAPRTRLAEGLRREAAALAELAVSPTCKHLVGLFQLSEEAKKLALLPDGERAPAVRRGGVIGAGVMGGAIAGLMAEKGMRARLSDIAREPLDAALHEHRGAVEKKRRRRRLQRHEAEAALDRLEVTQALDGFQRADLVIEAVAERMDVKRKVLGALVDQLRPEALIATNTSSLSVDAMAEGLPGPERVVGIHFFNPVRKMPLVEIVRGAHTSDAVVATACRFATDLGKTPVVVKDVAGFLVNRILGPYLDEAVRLFEEGADPVEVDRLAVAFGMPMGPFELLDEVGLDIAAHAALSLEEAYGERMTASRVLATLVEAGELGKKTEFGIYAWSHPKKGRRRLERGALNSRLQAMARPEVPPSERDVLDRLMLSMVNEAARCLEEEVVASPGELDLASVFGMGFAPFRGGLVRYADERGAAEVVARLRELAAAPVIANRPGGPAKFAPAALLVALAEGGGRFHGNS